MGVPATVKWLQSKAGNQQFSQYKKLKGTKLIVDCTDSMYWFVRRNLLNGHDRMDKYGTNMVEVGRFFRNFFTQLNDCGIKPVVVFEGARAPSRKYGDLVSKERHLEKSARIRHMKLMRSWARSNHNEIDRAPNTVTRDGNERSRSATNTYSPAIEDSILPPLTANVIKEVIEDLNREGQMSIETYQAPYETYPVLEMLADRHSCPVLTSHSDFILSSAPQGFIWSESLLVRQQTGQAGSRVDFLPVDSLFQHRSFLQAYGLTANGRALRTLYALLRNDFAGAHYDILNRLFAVPHHLQFRPDDTRFVEGGRNRSQPFLARLEYILSHWPREFQTPADVRSRLAALATTSPRVLKDYDALYMTFTLFAPLDETNEQNPIRETRLLAETIAQVHKATKDRQATFSYMSDIFMHQKNFNRLCVEDLDQPRTSYFLGDRVKMHLMEVGNVAELYLMDRLNGRYAERRLMLDSAPKVDSSWPMDKTIYSLFRFPDEFQTNRAIETFLSPTILAAALKDNYAKHLIVLLSLARFAFNESQVGRSSNYAGAKAHYFDAIFNCFMYHAVVCESNKMLAFNLQDRARLPGQLHNSQFVTSLAEAKLEIDSGRLGRLSTLAPNYVQSKHLVEMLNSTWFSYCQVNAFRDYAAHRLEATLYFQGDLILRIYRRLSRMDQRRGTSLMRLKELVPAVYEILMRE